MQNKMMSVADASDLISSGSVAVVAGDEAVLAKLPKGNWIGGTSVYFLTETGGRVDRENVFVTTFDDVKSVKCRFVPTEALPGLTSERFENGATMILLPAFSKSHQEFALDGATYPGLFDQPVMGWISGVHLDDIGKVSPKVFDGATGLAHDEGAAVMHLELENGFAADIDIVNLFTQDAAGDEITFPGDGFSAETAMVNGKEVNLAKWITENEVDTRFPLVANYAGAMINVSFQNVDTDAGQVAFYAPVVEGVTYKLAKDPGDYATAFASQAGDGGQSEMSCNCILNYLYGELESKITGGFTGPATFGEIAFILLNQTLVRMQTVELSKTNAA